MRKKDYWTVWRILLHHPFSTVGLTLVLLLLAAILSPSPEGWVPSWVLPLCFIGSIWIQKKYYNARYRKYGKQSLVWDKEKRRRRRRSIINMMMNTRSPLDKTINSVGNGVGNFFAGGGYSQQDYSARNARAEADRKMWQHYRDQQNAAYQEYQAKQKSYYNANSYDAYRQRNIANAARNQANKPYK